MGENSQIEWTDHTFNPWMGCTKISPGCDHCYAEVLSRRFGHAKWGNNPRNRTSRANWKKPITWNGRAKEFEQERGRRQRVFCASMADVFDNQVPADWRLDLFALICECRKLDWLVLTKRPQNILRMLPKDWGDGNHRQSPRRATDAFDPPARPCVVRSRVDGVPETQRRDRRIGWSRPGRNPGDWRAAIGISALVGSSGRCNTAVKFKGEDNASNFDFARGGALRQHVHSPHAGAGRGGDVAHASC